MDSRIDTGIDQLVFSGTGLTAAHAVVILTNQVYGSISGNYGIERIRFSNGVTWNETQLWNAIQ
jgi:acyl dehydratase